MSDTAAGAPLGPTPITDAVEKRCEEALKLFMAMPAAQRTIQLPELVSHIAHEILTECRNLERKEYHAIMKDRMFGRDEFFNRNQVFELMDAARCAGTDMTNQDVLNDVIEDHHPCNRNQVPSD